jgi:hypothetical protein
MKISKSKKIKFATSGPQHGTLLEYSPTPVTAKSLIPEWYKETKNIKSDSAENAIKKNIKDCMPFLDTLMSGYIWTLPSDLYVERVPGKDSEPKITMNPEVNYIDTRTPMQSGKMSVPDGCYDTHFVWKHPLHIKTPPGYSILVTHPLNRHDLPFISLSGMVDSDKTVWRPGNYPFFIKKNFEGVIPKGTPVLQIIPIKRDNWVSENDKSMLDSWSQDAYEVGSILRGWYKKAHWQRKSYR